jgi:hypothetical protein
LTELHGFPCLYTSKTDTIWVPLLLPLHGVHGVRPHSTPLHSNRHGVEWRRGSLHSTPPIEGTVRVCARGLLLSRATTRPQARTVSWKNNATLIDNYGAQSNRRTDRSRSKFLAARLSWFVCFLSRHRPSLMAGSWQRTSGFVLGFCLLV